MCGSPLPEDRVPEAPCPEAEGVCVGGRGASRAGRPSRIPPTRQRPTVSHRTDWAVLVTAHLPCRDRGASAAGLSKVLGPAIGGDREGGSCFKTCSASNSLSVCLMDKVGMSQRVGGWEGGGGLITSQLCCWKVPCVSASVYTLQPHPLPHPGGITEVQTTGLGLRFPFHRRPERLSTDL